MVARSRDGSLGTPKMEAMVVGFLEASLFRLHFLPLGVNEMHGNTPRLPNKDPLCSLWLDKLLAAGQRLRKLEFQIFPFSQHQ